MTRDVIHAKTVPVGGARMTVENHIGPIASSHGTFIIPATIATVRNCHMCMRHATMR